MPADRIIVEILTTASTAGIEQAKAGFAGLNVSSLALTAGVGLLTEAGKSMIEIAEKQDASQKGLNQAYDAAGIKLSDYQYGIDAFMQSNRAYYSVQTDVTDGFAKLTRAGLNQNEVLLDMNRAVDLAALKHISLGDAVDLLVKAEGGRMRGLIDLGITTAKYTDTNGNLIVAQHSVKQAMEELDPKLAHGRETTTDLAKSSNELSNDWQDLAKTGGPGLVTALDAVVVAADKVYKGFVAFGKNDDWWKGFNDGLINVLVTARNLLDDLNAIQSLGMNQSTQNGGYWGNHTGLPDPSQRAYGGRASGGPVWPGGTYTVGEHGPETLVMGRRGGMVIPGAGGSGGGQVNATFYISGADDPATVARAVDQRLRGLFIP